MSISLLAGTEVPVAQDFARRNLDVGSMVSAVASALVVWSPCHSSSVLAGPRGGIVGA